MSAPGNEADFGGVRTYTFWAVLGCTGAYLSGKFSPAVLAVVLIVIAAHLTAIHFRVPAGRRPPGSTTFAASLLTCLLGALVQIDQTAAAVLVAAMTSVLIGLKQPIHAWTRAFTAADIRATLQFVAISGVMLPLLPNRAFGPFAAFNPYSTWLMVVLISGMGFAGYLMMRLLGAKSGITITGLVGGLASSTATTLAFSRRSREDAPLSTSYALAVVLACTVMLIRILVVVGLLNTQLAATLLVPFLLMALPGICFAVWVWVFNRPDEIAVDTPQIHNPLSLAIAIKFGLIYAVVAFLVKAVLALDLRGGLLPLSFLSGLTDMDAIALLMANSRNEAAVDLLPATRAVIVAALGNTAMKAGMAAAFGSPALRRQVAIVLALTGVVGFACLWLI